MFLRGIYLRAGFPSGNRAQFFGRNFSGIERASAPGAQIRLPTVVKALYGAGVVKDAAEKIDHTLPPSQPVREGATPEHGAYVANACIGCHGEHLSGGQIPGAPPEMAHPMNITTDTVTGIGKWTQAEFTKAIREGIRPDGTHLKPDMPYQQFARYSDDEVAAIWMYLRTVPAKAYGGR